MLVMRFSRWIAQVEEKLEQRLSTVELDEAIRCYYDGWTVDDFACEVTMTRYDKRLAQYAEARCR